MSARVGVFGATGYAGREAIRLLKRHPRARVAFTSDIKGDHIAPDAGVEQPAEAYLLALPHGVAATYVARLREKWPSAVVVDFSGDLRLPTPEAYERWYGHEHKAKHLLGQAVFGLTEVYRDRIRGARLVSNPGCYATSVMLPLVPLLRDGLIDESDIVADAKSGATGAGRSPREDLLFCELADDFSAYKPGHVHAHVGEIEAVLAATTGKQRRADVLSAPAAGQARHPDGALREDEEESRRAAARAARLLRRDRLRARGRRRAAAALRDRRDQRLSDLGARRRGRARRRLLGHRQPGEGRRRPGDPEPEPGHGLARDGRPRLGVRARSAS